MSVHSNQATIKKKKKHFNVDQCQRKQKKTKNSTNQPRLIDQLSCIIELFDHNSILSI